MFATNRALLGFALLVLTGSCILSSCARVSRDPENKHFSIPLLFSYDRDSKGYNFWLFPFKRAETDEVSEIGVRPLVFFREMKKPHPEKTGQIFPFLWHRAPYGKSFDIFPILSTDQENSSQTQKNNFVLTPILFREWEKHALQETTFEGIIPFFHYREITDERESDTYFIPPWLWYRDFEKTQEKTTTTTMILWLLFKCHEVQKLEIKDSLYLFWPIFKRESTQNSTGKLTSYRILGMRIF